AATVTEDVPIPGAADIRLGPKERLEMLKDAARLKRDQAVAAARTERTKLWLQRTPASVAKFQWLRDALNSDDPDIQEIAQSELERLQAPSDRVDLGRDRLAQQDRQHKERLQAAIDLLDKRLEAAKERNDTRLQAGLERQRERFQQRLDEIDMLQSGQDYRAELGSDTKLEIAGVPGTRAGAVADMKTDDALGKLKELRQKLYFPGQSAAVLDTLEKAIGQLQVQERSHIGPTLTRRLQRLGDQLDRAERREGVRPQPQTPPSPPPAGRQSSALTSSGPVATLVKTYEDM